MLDQINIRPQLLVYEPMFESWQGLRITPDHNETVRECLERCTTFNLPACYPIIKITITCPACGYKAEYETLDDIPDHDVPCPCGKPDYYLIKIGRN